jgi:hypothetical protein
MDDFFLQQRIDSYHATLDPLVKAYHQLSDTYPSWAPYYHLVMSLHAYLLAASMGLSPDVGISMDDADTAFVERGIEDMMMDGLNQQQMMEEYHEKFKVIRMFQIPLTDDQKEYVAVSALRIGISRKEVQEALEVDRHTLLKYQYRPSINLNELMYFIYLFPGYTLHPHGKGMYLFAYAAYRNTGRCIICKGDEPLTMDCCLIHTVCDSVECAQEHNRRCTGMRSERILSRLSEDMKKGIMKPCLLSGVPASLPSSQQKRNIKPKRKKYRKRIH